MIKRFLAFLSALVLLPFSLSLAEEETEPLIGPVTRTMDELNAMLDSGNPVTTMISEPFYENVTDENAALDALGSVMEQLGCDDTTQLVLDTIRPTEDGLTVYTFLQQAGDLAVNGGAAKLIVDSDGTAVVAMQMYGEDPEHPDMWMLDGNHWVQLDQDGSIPEEDTSYIFDEGYIYELPTDGLPE